MSHIPMEDKLCEFMAEYANDECVRDVLQLLGRHPRTRLNRLAIRHAIDWRRSDVDRALGRLIDRRVVRTGMENDQAVYCLSGEEPQHSLAVKVGALDPAQWRSLLKRASVRQIVMPTYKSSLSARERDIMVAFRHKSAFVLPVMPRFTRG